MEGGRPTRKILKKYKYILCFTALYEESSCPVSWRIKRVSALVAIIIDRVNAPNTSDTSTFSNNFNSQSGTDVYPILPGRESGLIGSMISTDGDRSNQLLPTTVRKETDKGVDNLCKILERRGLVHLRPKEYRVKETEGRSAGNA